MVIFVGIALKLKKMGLNESLSFYILIVIL